MVGPLPPREPCFIRLRQPWRGPAGGRAWLAVVVFLAAAAVGNLPAGRAIAADEQAQEQDDEEAIEARVSLPTDRLKERQLDRARRLVADERWSDAATLLDEMLVGDRDFFFRPRQGETTWRSIKTEATRLIGTLPPAGQAAYDLQFSARAERLLRESVAAGDASGVVAVARRWFHTPAGRRATLLAALESLDADQPLAAAAWLERLADGGGGAEFEPTLSVMRAVAWWRAGDRRTAVGVLEEARRRGGTVVRIGGRDVSLAASSENLAAWLGSVAGVASGAADRRDAEWWMARGDAARNARVEASRPLLVPRYRVPLTRHPEEARLLEKRRRSAADRDAPLIPAGAPLAVDGMLVLHAPLGLLAVDFTTGKRVWMRGAATFDAGGPPEADASADVVTDGADSLQRVFNDATSGVVSSNGRFVYAVESPGRERRAEGPRRAGAAPDGPGENALVAYDLTARGAPAWRRPAADDAAAAGGTFHLGAPLVIGDQLFVLAEERGEIRLDVLDATDGRQSWSQPLAELDEQQADRPETMVRRSSGLSPAFADGVLVCPTGAGTAIAVDLATRTLLWAFNYSVAKADGGADRLGQRGPLGNVMRRVVVNGVPVGEAAPGGDGWRDACPIVASGRVLLTPVEADALHCLDLRTGGQRWVVPRGESMYVAGVVDDRVIVVGNHGVDCLSLATGQSVWPKPLGFGPAAVSGRGVLSPGRLYLPLDTPEVVEIDLANGGIVGRSPARGGVIPGNLVAYRGEIVSQGVDFLDVFHQVAPLEERIETAGRARPDDPWVRLWRGQLDLDAGRIADGLQSIAAARQADPARVPAEILADALLFGMRRDFAAATPLWHTLVEVAGPLPRSKALQCVAIDNLLAAGAFADAWSACRTLLELPPATPGDDDWLIDDVADPRLVVSEPRWMQGRLRDLWAKAPPAVRQEMDVTLAAAVDRARETAAAEGDPVDALTRVATQFAAHPAGIAARRMLADAIDARLAAPGSARDAARPFAVRRDLLLLAERRSDERGTAGQGESSSVDAALVSAGPWPLGRVAVQRSGRPKPEDAMRFSRTIPIPLDPRSTSVVPGLQVGCDIQAQALVLSDGFGRRIGEPIPFDPARNGGLHPLFQPLHSEATALGPLLLVRSGGAFAAFDVRGPAGPPPERLWLAADGAPQPAELPGFAIHVGRGGSTLRRHGHAALGMRIVEPELPAGPHAARGMLLVAEGVALARDNSLELRDPVSGVVGWRRHRLPAAGELLGDDEFLCVCPRDGRQATVVATADGRLVRTCTLPSHELRLAAAGRRVIAIVPPASGSGSVALECIDPARDERTSLGEFSPAARATQAGHDLLVVLEPDGMLTGIDIQRGSARFRARLPEMPAGLEHLTVLPWQDRLIVIAGRRETPQEQEQFEKLGHVSPLPQMMPGDDMTGQTFTGSIWAVSRTTGEPLWPVPATVVRHCLHRHQPAELPVLVFARHVQSRRDGNVARLGMLLLDKRTGHAVYADDRMPMQPHVLSGCDVSGDPERHIVALGRAAADAAEIRLEFTGEPMAPRPPYQAATRPAGGDFLSELESWLQRALTIPLPF